MACIDLTLSDEEPCRGEEERTREAPPPVQSPEEVPPLPPPRSSKRSRGRAPSQRTGTAHSDQESEGLDLGFLQAPNARPTQLSALGDDAQLQGPPQGNHHQSLEDDGDDNDCDDGGLACDATQRSPILRPQAASPQKAALGSQHSGSPPRRKRRQSLQQQQQQRQEQQEQQELHDAWLASTLQGASSDDDGGGGGGQRGPSRGLRERKGRGSRRQSDSSFSGMEAMQDEQDEQDQQDSEMLQEEEDQRDEDEDEDAMEDTPPRARGGKREGARKTESEKAEERERKRLAKEEEKEAKRAAREQGKLDKAAAKEQEKLNKRQATEVQRALKGSNVERDMVLHMSGRVVELPWSAVLLHTLQEQGIEYKVDSSPSPISSYAWMRWGRRMHRAAAEAFLQAQGVEAPQAGGASSSTSSDPMAACSQVMELLPGRPEQPSEAELGFQLLLVFLSPSDLVSQLVPGSGRNPREGLLHSLRTAVRSALPACTLMVGCAGLARHLDSLERAPGSLFNRGSVEDALLDLAVRYPAIRLRTDLVDGAQAADVLVTLTACLASHHKRQQDGYLKNFGTSRLPAMHGALDGASASCRATAHALCHLMPPDKAIAVAKEFQSLGGLMAAYAAQSTLRAKEEMLVGLTIHSGRGRALGKKVSADVYRYLHCSDPTSQAREALQDD